MKLRNRGLSLFTDGSRRIGTVPKRIGNGLSILLLGCYIVLLLSVSASIASEKWQGVDKTVVEDIAKEHGRGAKEPLINTDKGDLLLFVFLLAGTAGGFAAGYYWRMLISERRSEDKDK